MHDQWTGDHSVVTPLAIGFIEPHLETYGGIRRALEFANRLSALGNRVTVYVPEGTSRRCTWMPCHATVKHIPAGFRDDLDVLVFNDERQWHLLDLFENARRRVFYVLHCARLYGKAGAWESLRADVDLLLANSAWTADRVEEEIGRRPKVALSGIDRTLFRPVDVPKRYPLLCVGDVREWKGTATIEAAAGVLGLPVEKFGPKRLPQAELAAEYCSADVFAVGSAFEGFGQPGLEALACGVPLVTTDTGGSREYAVDGTTALVVPPDDPGAMAEAIDRLRRDHELAGRLRANGLRLVEEKFGWDERTRELQDLLEEAVAAPVSRTADDPLLRHSPAEQPVLSVVVLAWDQLAYTQRCVESIRRHTDVPYELIVVDNGSGWAAAHYASRAADVFVGNEENLGFAAGMNCGLRAARGDYVAFVNNDTVVPPGWAAYLVGDLQADPSVALAVPGITAGSNQRTVRSEPEDVVETLAPFEAPPSGVVYVLPRETAVALGGWSEIYEVASGEDVDLCFKAWVNDLDIVFDHRVLVEHEGKVTASRLPDWRAQWDQNRDLFLSYWAGPQDELPRLDSCDPARWERNRETARAVAGWMRLNFEARRELADHRGTSATLRLRMFRVIRRRVLRRGGMAERAARRAWELAPAPARRRLRGSSRRFEEQVELVQQPGQRPA